MYTSVPVSTAHRAHPTHIPPAFSLARCRTRMSSRGCSGAGPREQEARGRLDAETGGSTKKMGGQTHARRMRGAGREAQGVGESQRRNSEVDSRGVFGRGAPSHPIAAFPIPRRGPYSSSRDFFFPPPTRAQATWTPLLALFTPPAILCLRVPRIPDSKSLLGVVAVGSGEEARVGEEDEEGIVGGGGGGGGGGDADDWRTMLVGEGEDEGGWGGLRLGGREGYRGEGGPRLGLAPPPTRNPETPTYNSHTRILREVSGDARADDRHLSLLGAPLDLGCGAQTIRDEDSCRPYFQVPRFKSVLEGLDCPLGRRMGIDFRRATMHSMLRGSDERRNGVGREVERIMAAQDGDL
ncbi:hypothetical protein B0H11DRAFT_1932955 [Mycena galericulata]|nr:hypothetical protein B0H11DRAFT_1932955 [Mycena galericulata]